MPGFEDFNCYYPNTEAERETAHTRFLDDVREYTKKNKGDITSAVVGAVINPGANVISVAARGIVHLVQAADYCRRDKEEMDFWGRQDPNRL
ncbi:MAG: hypothetical protein Q8T09_01740 [Candidatus Melainabacteria bacterium]|nr:hypothetical protein [Candidatus Melainabacteria bacterium]